MSALRPVADWRGLAACRDENPEVFFPTAERGPLYETQVAAAKRVCARCPVRRECLAEALERIPAGVAGGLDEHERRRCAATRGERTAGACSPKSRTGGDGRGRAAAQVAAGRSCSAVAAEHGVSERTVQRWTRGGAA